eukprot:TRINITY_DN9162_c5_g1_i1.p1 TRINITY_DN9162_c5_g1~~TRINITY_DN9162_c5_g1_i1.p1  ORF type:complete len:211 (+),score=17.20 TRINITY_DN9162_c5_g1_i1:56-634(+)
MAETKPKRQALIVVDIQKEYFPGGKMELHCPELAAANAKVVLDAFREKKLPVIHIRHVMLGSDAPAYIAGTEGVEPYPLTAPVDSEPLVTKHAVNAFKDTPLLGMLKDAGATDVVLVGSMSHMCIDAATRAAADLGFAVTVCDDACATRDMEHRGVTVPAPQVHAAYMGALAWGYAKVRRSEEVASEIKASA